MIRNKVQFVACLISTAILLTSPLLAEDTAEDSKINLEQAFRDPPAQARPRVWWHWMNGNVTKEGIAKDLLWMKQIGIGGLQNFDANLATPQIVDKRLVYMTPEWKDAFRFAVNEAERLGLEFAIAASPGWSETGGPWVSPSDGMKKLVWSEARVTGGKRFRGSLPKLPNRTGPFQSMQFSEEMPVPGSIHSEKPIATDEIAVIAFRENTPALTIPDYTLEDGTPLSNLTLTDADLATAVQVPLAEDRTGIAVARFPTPVTVRALRLFLPGLKLPFRDVPFSAKLEVQDGAMWLKVVDVPLTGVPTTRSFPAVTGAAFRVVVSEHKNAPNLDALSAAPGAVAINFFNTGPVTALPLADFQLFAEPKVDRSEEKSGYETVLDYHAIATKDDIAGVDPSTVVDLTSYVHRDGTLDWTPPSGGDWRIMRFGWTLTGKTNHPATPEATGLEVDKYDAAAVQRYLETYLAMYRDAVGPELIGKHGIKALLTDSIEVGKANWTPTLENEFAKRRGYSLRPWLPALAGNLMDSAVKTDRFLFDFRQTLSELLAEKHYGTIARVAHDHGLIVYGEALEEKRPLLGDDLAMRSYADIPMAALWAYQDERQLRSTLIGDMRGAASVAHILGKPYVAAESMTSVNVPWDFAPSSLKRVIDLEFASGINRPVIHTSVHQPVDDKQPGLTLAIFGQHFNRHESWSGLARPWIDYISRSSLMLQQGKNVADVAWFIGEESPLTALYAEKAPANLPTANAWDFINAGMLQSAISNDGAELVSTGGARFQAIYLGGTSHQMTLPTLERLAFLVRGGATLIGVKPVATPSAADDTARFVALADALWSGDVGKGRVIATAAIDVGLKQAGVAADFIMSGTQPGDVQFVHRKIQDGDMWFLNNRRNVPYIGEARFRISGKQPELWRAETGKSEALSYRIEDGVTIVPLSLAAEDAAFVVFRKPAVKQVVTVPKRVPVKLASLDGAWNVAFQPGRGAPNSITLPKLLPLEKHPDPSVKYFSGIASYSKTFKLPRKPLSGTPLWLDLGEVGEIAEVLVNGKVIGAVWHKPYRVDISGSAKRGENKLEVRVANLWVNRMIGDAQAGADKITFTTVPTYYATAPLRRSGLAGPITIVQE